MLGDGDDAADAAGDHDADPFGVSVGDGYATVVVGLYCRGKRQLDEAVYAAGLLAVDEVGRLKVLDFGRDGGLVALGVEGGDGIDPGLAGDDGLPGGVGIKSEGTDNAQSGYENAVCHMGTIS